MRHLVILRICEILTLAATVEVVRDLKKPGGQKASGIHLQHTDGAVGRDVERPNPTIGFAPDDFFGIGYADLQTKREQLVTGPDGLDVPGQNRNAIPWYGRSLLTDRQTSLGSRWGQFRSPLGPQIEPLIPVFVGKSGKPFPVDLVAESPASFPSGENPRKGSSRRMLLNCWLARAGWTSAKRPTLLGGCTERSRFYSPRTDHGAPPLPRYRLRRFDSPPIVVDSKYCERRECGSHPVFPLAPRRRDFSERSWDFDTGARPM